eukprot:gene6988-9550_t
MKKLAAPGRKASTKKVDAFVADEDLAVPIATENISKSNSNEGITEINANSISPQSRKVEAEIAGQLAAARRKEQQDLEAQIQAEREKQASELLAEKQRKHTKDELARAERERLEQHQLEQLRIEELRSQQQKSKSMKSSADDITPPLSPINSSSITQSLSKPDSFKKSVATTSIAVEENNDENERKNREELDRINKQKEEEKLANQRALIQKQKELEEEEQRVELERIKKEKKREEDERLAYEQKELLLRKQKEQEEEEEERIKSEKIKNERIAYEQLLILQKQKEQEEYEEKLELEKIENERIRKEKQRIEEEKLFQLQQQQIEQERIEAEKIKEKKRLQEIQKEEEDERIYQQQLFLQQQKEQKEREEQEKQEKEELELEKVRLAALETAKIAFLESQNNDNAALLEQKKKSDAQKKKREQFLNDMDSFSVDFQNKTHLKEEKIRDFESNQDTILIEKMKLTSESYVSDTIKSLPEPPKTANNKEIKPELTNENTKKIIKNEENDDDNNNVAIKLLNSNEESKQFNNLTKSLFDSELINDNNVDPLLNEEPNKKTSQDEILKVPTRIGSKANSIKGKNNDSTSIITSVPTKKYFEDDDEEEEGMGDPDSLSHILTLEERRTLTVAQKATWKAKQNDLTSRRKDFHGVVTYCFEGIFSWQMYGSAEAVDSTGNPYTEYLMRCQWGSTFDNMQPWIVAHRYKEFDQLDSKLKKMYPDFSHVMPSLPQKDLFRYLDATVISKRRTALEEYMSRIVSSLPTILRSALMVEFLQIQERINSIKKKLSITTVSETEYTPPKFHEDGMLDSISSSINHDEYYQTNNMNNNIQVDKEEGKMSSNNITNGKARVQFDEGISDKTNLPSGQVKSYTTPQSDYDTNELDILQPNGNFQSLLSSCQTRWPRLRATAVVGMGVDFSLIPRAMQAEEDLIRYIRDYKSMKLAYSFK